MNPIWDETLELIVGPADYDKRLLVGVWDWDRASTNDFMGAFSFGISELRRSSADGWYKLLGQDSENSDWLNRMTHK